MKLNNCIRAGVLFGLVALQSHLLAVPISVTSRAALGGNDYVDWATEGGDGDSLGSTFNAVSQGGLGVAVSGATQSFVGFERVDQGVSWTGNFAPDDALLWTGFGLEPQTLTLEFASPVFGAGAQIQNDFPDNFTALLFAYDTGGNLLYSDSFAGFSSNAGDNSAIFIGVLNDLQNISKIEIAIENSGSFAINRLDLVRSAAVPESGEYLALMFAFTVAGMSLFRRVTRAT